MIALIGGTGTVGQHLLRGLLSAGRPCRVLTRDPEAARAMLTASDLPPEQANLATFVAGGLAPGEMDDAALHGFLAGVERLYLSTAVHPDLPALQLRALEAARAAGVRRIVKLSNMGAGRGAAFPTAHWHGIVEEALAQCADDGMEWVSLRPHMFMQNLLLQLPRIRESGVLAGPYGQGRIAMIDARDIAAAAQAALMGAGTRQAHPLTGPQALDFAQVAEHLTQALGRPVRYQPQTPQEARTAMIAGGRPDWYTDALLVVFGMWARNEMAQVSPAVEMLTGHPPRSLTQFLADHQPLWEEKGGL